MANNSRLIDMAGVRIGRWTVLFQTGNTAKGGALWRCKCACGVERSVLGADLRKGKSLSCGGCVHDHRLANLEKCGLPWIKHGASGTRLHGIWKNMLGRCRGNHPHYGGRGIKVCADWQEFTGFADWAHGAGYRDDLSIERLDNSKGYFPGNCIWADRYVQALNRRTVLRLPDGSAAITAARKNGVPPRVMRRRVSEGWPIEQAVSHPFNVRRIPRVRTDEGRFQ